MLRVGILMFLLAVMPATATTLIEDLTFDRAEVQGNCSVMMAGDEAQTETCVTKSALSYAAFQDLTTKVKGNRLLIKALEQCAWQWKGHWPFIQSCADEMASAAAKFVALTEQVPRSELYEVIATCVGNEVYTHRQLSCLEKLTEIYSEEWALKKADEAASE